MNNLLNYRLEGDGDCIVLIHGLFGSLDNLGVLARELKNHYQVLSVDLRNHGLSFHHPVMDYASMAEDVIQLLNELGIQHYHLIGHSMGGKTAMAIAAKNPPNQTIGSLIVLDIAPIAYQERRHDDVFLGLNAVSNEAPTTRQQALDILAQYISSNGVRQFLAKSLHLVDNVMQWRFNAKAIIENYETIMGWQAIGIIDLPTLFVKGELSNFLTAEHQSQIVAQFSNSKAHVVAGAGHWLHAEKPAEVQRVVSKFLEKNK